MVFFFFSSRRRHTRWPRDWSSDVCSSDLPGVPVAASHEVLPLFREFERTSTTTVEAYLRPKISAYVARLERAVESRGDTGLRIMSSAGGTLAPRAAACRAAALALSG